MIDRAVVMCVWVALSPLAGWAAMPGQQPVVLSVEFEGLARVSETFTRGIVRTAPGEAYDPTGLDADVGRLLRTGRFLSARYTVKETADGVAVTFHLHERPVVTAIRFVGNKKFKDRKLAKTLAIAVDDPFDVFELRGGLDAILAVYREAGYGDVVVACDEELVGRTGELVVTIEEGTRGRIRAIRFEGATAFSPRLLKRQIRTRKSLWIIRTGAFDGAQVEADTDSLQAYYRGQGFLDAGVTYRRELSADGSKITVVFVIDEQTRYAVEEIRIEGNDVYGEAELLSLMGLRQGETIRQRQLDADVRAIQQHYGEYGYIYASVRANRVFSSTPGLVTVTIQIDERDQYRVGKITPRGNAQTKDKVVRRALRLYPPDDLLDLTEVREAQRRLLEAGIFEPDGVRIYPVGDEPGVRDVIMDVVEAQTAGDFLFGVGVTSNSGVVGSIILDLKNFDLYDPPRTFKELIKFRAFRGGGQRLRLELQPGTELSRFRIDYTEPYFLDKPLRLGTSVYLFLRGRDTYDEERTGFSASLGKRFERGRLHGWSGEVGVRFEDVSIEDIEPFASSQAFDVEGSNLITSFRGALIRDRTDNRFIPTRGDRLRIGYEQVLGDFTFGKITTGYTWHTTIRRDRLDRPSVLTLKGEAGFIVGDSPIFERFFAGGVGSLRGFRFRGIGERDGRNETNVGGEFRLLTSGEYSFPLYGDVLRGLTFLDMGTVEEDFGITTWRASVGVGVRLTINLFGPLPLEFDLALPISSDSDDDERVFSFFIGTAF